MQKVILHEGKERALIKKCEETSFSSEKKNHGERKQWHRSRKGRSKRAENPQGDN